MDFKSIIKEQREELEKIEKEEKIIERTGLNKSKESLKYPNILAILGIRRCGKSIFSYLLAKPHKFAYINFDDERLAGLKSDDLNKILESFYELYEDIDYIILDEIQNVDNWELFVNRLRRTKKIILTGSNSKLLSGELSTHLTGRYLDIILFPFSFKEFLKLKEVKENKVYTTKEEIKKLAKYLITNSSGEITYSKLARIFNIKHVSTISNWISYLENAFLIFRLERLIQVSYINSKEEIKEREITALLKSSKELRCNNLIVITWDYETEEKFDGENIKFIPLWKWLLE